MLIGLIQAENIVAGLTSPFVFSSGETSRAIQAVYSGLEDNRHIQMMYDFWHICHVIMEFFDRKQFYEAHGRWCKRHIRPDLAHTKQFWLFFEYQEFFSPRTFGYIKDISGLLNSFG